MIIDNDNQAMIDSVTPTLPHLDRALAVTRQALTDTGTLPTDITLARITILQLRAALARVECCIELEQAVKNKDNENL